MPLLWGKVVPRRRQRHDPELFRVAVSAIVVTHKLCGAPSFAFRIVAFHCRHGRELHDDEAVQVVRLFSFARFEAVPIAMQLLP